MNNRFSFKRSWILARLLFISNKKLMLYFSLTIAVILMFIYALCLLNIDSFYNDEDSKALQYAVLITGMGLVASISSSLAFSHIHKKEKAIAFYMVPARVSEKFIAQISIYTLIPILMYILVFLCVTSIYLAIHNSYGVQLRLPYKTLPFQKATLINPFSFGSYNTTLYLTSLFYFYLLTMTSIYLMGSALLKKFQFIQTMVYFGAYSIINVLLLINIFQVFDHQEGISISPFYFEKYDENKFIYIYGTEYLLCYGLPAIVTTLCLYTAWQKVKTQQV